MKILFSIFLLLQASITVAQNLSTTEYSINLTSYFYGHYIDYNTNGQNVEVSSQQIFALQPSLRIKHKNHFTEIGFRNIALNDLIASKGNIVPMGQQTQNMLCYNTSASVALFYAKNYRLLGTKKIGLWFGGDISYGYEYLNSLYTETTTGDYYEIIKKNNQIGIASVLRFQYDLTPKLNIDFAAFAQLVNFTSTNYTEGPMLNSEKTSSLNFINFGYPQVTFGFKI